LLDGARETLRSTFGHADFRGLQAGVIAEVLAGRNVLAVLPTGGGKSLCYQIPALVRTGLGLVVSPLIALMSDQVAALQQSGVAAEKLDSSLDYCSRDAIWRRIGEGALDLLYLSPEGLMQSAMLERLVGRQLALVAIDEAHCVSQWGHDFRPEYRMLGRLAQVFPTAPRLAVTATADARTRADIRVELRLGDAREFVDSFARPELALSAERKQADSHARVLELVLERPARSGVIYAGTRKAVEELADRLSAASVPALAYHAGLDREVRTARLNTFLDADAAVMVATIAFGMGIDKPDVRYVMHADPPASIEAYWQEIGRAGRDGAPAEGITLYSASDMAWAFRRISGRAMEPPTKAAQMRKVRQLYAMLEGTACRPAAVRRYFGEEAVATCGQCDLCLNPRHAVDTTRAAQMALSAVHRLGGSLGRGRVIDHLLGKKKDQPAGERRLSTFGIGREVSAPAWRDLIDQLVLEGLLREDFNDGRPLIGLGEAAEVGAVYRGERRVAMRQLSADGAVAARGARSRTKRGGRGRFAVAPADAPLFAALRVWRRARAAEQHVPPYAIFHDVTLAAIARHRPADQDGLASISGVGRSKLARYGEAVLSVVRAVAGPASASHPAARLRRSMGEG
jgi:ATP-dependent DNA helicase RecQ